MTRIVARHAGTWIMAGVLFAVLGVASAMPQPQADVAVKERVMSPRAAQTMVQDPSGRFVGYRSALAFGAK